MKKMFTGQLMLLLTLCCTQLYAQLGYITHFRGPANDSLVATTKLINSEYYAVGNTTTGGGNPNKHKILISRLSAGGNIMWSRVIQIPGLNEHCWATDIQAGYSSLTPSANTYPPGNADPDFPSRDILPTPEQNSFDYLYISGKVVHASGATAMLVVQIDANANVLWARYDFNQGNANIEEEGVSVESAPNGDVFLVGKHRYVAENVTGVSVARLDNTGTLVWSNRYSDPTVRIGNFMPYESCIFQEDTATIPSCIAITGSYYPNMGLSYRGRTFVMADQLWRHRELADDMSIGRNGRRQAAVRRRLRYFSRPIPYRSNGFCSYRKHTP